MELEVRKAKNALKGEITIPADKSISHRAVMFSSLANGTSVIENFSKGADCLSTLEVFKNLGVEAEYKDEKTLLVKSTGSLAAPKTDLYCGNSGTTMRLMAGILAGQHFTSVLTGDESLSKRPMKRIIEPLSLMGGKVFSEYGTAPLRIVGQKLSGINCLSRIASAQVKSCVLLAGIHAHGKTTYSEPYISRNHTELMLEYLGANINHPHSMTAHSTTISVANSRLIAKTITIPGDISSAAFFIVAALIVPDSEIILKDVGLNPTRTGILEVVEQMGADVEILDKKLVSNEQVGDIKIKYSKLKGCTIEGEIIPRLIDELPVIAVLATQAEGQTIIKNAEDLRYKESDRIKSSVSELKKLGADIKETKDGFIINGGKCGGKCNLKGGVEVDTYHDHRLAMSLYVAGLICENPILINGFEWVDISFPEFEELMTNLRNT